MFTRSLIPFCTCSECLEHKQPPMSVYFSDNLSSHYSTNFILIPRVPYNVPDIMSKVFWSLPKDLLLCRFNFGLSVPLLLLLPRLTSFVEPIFAPSGTIISHS